MISLGLENKKILIFGASNKKSIATHAAQLLIQAEAQVIFSVQSPSHQEQVAKIFPHSKIIVCDVENKESVISLSEKIAEDKLDGLLHSIAYGEFEGVPFHQTKREHFLQAVQISQFSFLEVTHQLLPLFNPQASLVTVSISNTKATSYGYLGPIKAMLEASVPFLAKSTGLRVNAVAAGPLKTSASAGIPNYIDNYLYAEAMTLRKKALTTNEVAQTILFLLSPLSSGINGTSILVDAGMHCNVFDQELVNRFHGKSL